MNVNAKNRKTVSVAPKVVAKPAEPVEVSAFADVIEEKKPETDDERYRRILAEAQASVARSEGVLKECEKTNHLTKGAIQ